MVPWVSVTKLCMEPCGGERWKGRASECASKRSPGLTSSLCCRACAVSVIFAEAAAELDH
jgi:hypothetical protein